MKNSVENDNCVIFLFDESKARKHIRGVKLQILHEILNFVFKLNDVTHQTALL